VVVAAAWSDVPGQSTRLVADDISMLAVAKLASLSSTSSSLHSREPEVIDKNEKNFKNQ
jgi:hypothetical protein